MSNSINSNTTLTIYIIKCFNCFSRPQPDMSCFVSVKKLLNEGQALSEPKTTSVVEWVLKTNVQLISTWFGCLRIGYGVLVLLPSLAFQAFVPSLGSHLASPIWRNIVAAAAAGQKGNVIESLWKLPYIFVHISSLYWIWFSKLNLKCLL